MMPLQWSPMEDVLQAVLKGHRTMNPCPVFERRSRRLFLFFICLKAKISECCLKPGQTRLCYVTSTDCGRTWSDLTDLTSSVIDANFTSYQTFAVGPGHGIQMGTGALLVPAYVKLVEGWGPCQACWCCCSCCPCVSAHSLVLRSDESDHHTWLPGQLVDMKTGECQLAEVTDGEGRTQVYLNARTSSGDMRLEALSSDGGESFTPLPHLTLVERPNGCQGSVLSFPSRELPPGGAAGAAAPETALLFSHPTAGEGWNRLELGLYLRQSLQDQHPWGKPHILHPGPSGYSDLTHCEEEGRFACLMECGQGPRLQVAFSEFHLTDVMTTPAP